MIENLIDEFAVPQSYHKQLKKIGNATLTHCKDRHCDALSRVVRCKKKRE